MIDGLVMGQGLASALSISGTAWFMVYGLWSMVDDLGFGTRAEHLLDRLTDEIELVGNVARCHELLTGKVLQAVKFNQRIDQRLVLEGYENLEG